MERQREKEAGREREREREGEGEGGVKHHIGGDQARGGFILSLAE